MQIILLYNKEWSEEMNNTIITNVLKEYEKKQIEKKNEELTYLKTLAEKIEQDLDDTKKSIAEVEAYNPSELTEQKLKDILKDVTETH